MEMSPRGSRPWARCVADKGDRHTGGSEGRRQEVPAGPSPSWPARPEYLVGSSVREVLNFFENCPKCGYSATATVVTRRFSGGSIETEMHLSCGLPCGWTGCDTLSPPKSRFHCPES